MCRLWSATAATTIGNHCIWVSRHCVSFLFTLTDGLCSPGETLPPFPEATHGLPGSGLRDYVTINQVISRIPRGAPDHDVEGALQRSAIDRRPFNANRQARTITCGGGENYHPSGRRGFTNREFACLQTFPMRFRFGPREVRKQIGNAVPPKLAEAIYRSVKASLQRTDEEETNLQRRGLH